MSTQSSPVTTLKQITAYESEFIKSYLYKVESEFIEVELTQIQVLDLAAMEKRIEYF